jgi:hypothetical protein
MIASRESTSNKLSRKIDTAIGSSTKPYTVRTSLARQLRYLLGYFHTSISHPRK